MFQKAKSSSASSNSSFPYSIIIIHYSSRANVKGNSAPAQEPKRIFSDGQLRILHCTVSKTAVLPEQISEHVKNNENYSVIG